MPILKSLIVEDRAQIDGRRAVREEHIDGLDRPQFVDYLAEPDADVDAMLPIRAALIDEALSAAEGEVGAKAALEKARAVALLSLKDDQVRDILKLSSVDDMVAERAALAVVAEVDVAVAVDAIEGLKP